MLSLLQKSRKIFDPADHDQPRKRKAVSPVVNVVDSNAAVAPPPVVTTTGSSLIDGSGCIYCGLTSPKQRKGGRQEALVRCNDCPTTGLFTTSAMPLALVDTILLAICIQNDMMCSINQIFFFFFLQCTQAVWTIAKNLSRR